MGGPEPTTRNDVPPLHARIVQRRERACATPMRASTRPLLRRLNFLHAPQHEAPVCWWCGQQLAERTRPIVAPEFFPDHVPGSQGWNHSATCAGAGGARLVEMGKPGLLGWIVFGGTYAMVILLGVSGVMLPQTEKLYCTADLGTCIMSGRSRPWHVLERPCPAGQSPRFVRPVVFVGVSRCHWIPVSGFSTPLSVCPAACRK